MGSYHRFQTLLRVMGNWGRGGVMCATVGIIPSNRVVHGNQWNVILYSTVVTLRTSTSNVHELHILYTESNEISCMALPAISNYFPLNP